MDFSKEVVCVPSYMELYPSLTLNMRAHGRRNLKYLCNLFVGSQNIALLVVNIVHVCYAVCVLYLHSVAPVQVAGYSSQQ